jgi:hypothetical protein
MGSSDSSFAPILAVAQLMQDFPGPWFVSGGWAIDLFHERVTREHQDAEVGIYRGDQGALWEHLRGWSFENAIHSTTGAEWVHWKKGDELRLPIHQIRVECPEPNTPGFEFLLNERTDTHWVSRRHPGLMVPLCETTTTSVLGIPILMPEIQLLYKAKQTRPKDQSDFEVALPRLTASQRHWLARTLRQYYPDQPWHSELRDDALA